MTSGEALIWIYKHSDPDSDDFKSKENLMEAVASADTKGSIREWIDNKGYNEQGRRFYDSEIQMSIDKYNEKLVTKQIKEATTTGQLKNIDLSAVSESKKAELDDLINKKENELIAFRDGVIEDKKDDATRKFIDAINSAKSQSELDAAVPSMGSIRREYGDDVRRAVSEALNDKANALESLEEEAVKLFTSRIEAAGEDGLSALEGRIDDSYALTDRSREELRSLINEKRGTLTT